MTLPLLKTFAAACTNSSTSFLNFPTWYEYLHKTTDPTTGLCSPRLTNINDVWLIVAAVIEILLRVAAILAVVFVIYGGVQYITSQGSPERTDQARKTIISAVIGLAIALVSSVVIGFLAKALSK